MFTRIVYFEKEAKKKVRCEKSEELLMNDDDPKLNFEVNESRCSKAADELNETEITC